MKIGIIGNGRFGSLLFKTLKTNTDCTVLMYSPLNTIDNHLYYSLADVCNCQVVIPCVPISEFENVIKQVSPLLVKNALVIDVCSVKVFPAQVMLSNLDESVDILSTHPMFGPDSTSNGETFKGLDFIFSKVRIKDKNRLNKILDFLKSLELNIIELSAEDHDKQAAYTQAFAFLVGKVGIKLNIRANQISTKGFQGILYNQTMVENDTGTLFRDMQNYNPYSQDMRKQVLNALQEIESELNNN